MQDPFISAVFNGAQATQTIAQGVSDVLSGTVNTLENMSNQFPGQPNYDQFSRRNFGGVQNPQNPQQPAYQPVTSNPWGNPNPTQNNGFGYPGISNPSYGKSGYVGTPYSTPSFNFPSFGFNGL